MLFESCVISARSKAILLVAFVSHKFESCVISARSKANRLVEVSELRFESCVISARSKAVSHKVDISMCLRAV